MTQNTWPGRFNNLDVPVHLLTKELSMEVSLRDIYFGYALGMLSSQYDIARVFPKVCSLKFQFVMIYSDLDIAANSQEIRQNITSFVQHIGQMVPMVRKVSVPLDCSFDEAPPTLVPFFGGLISQLYGLASHIEYCWDCDTVDIKLQPSIINNLTTIDCHVDKNIESFMTLARQNAPTLQSLAIKSGVSVDISGLVRDPNGGSYVQYTCMRTLTLDQMTDSAISRHTVFTGALPLPGLRCLDIQYDYPFGDDTLFRGNATTLEYLQIQLVDLTVPMLKKYRVFTPVSHLKLRRVKDWYDEEDIPGTLSTTSDYLCFVLNISLNASICSFYSVSGALRQQSELSLFGDYLYIRVLEMPDVRLDLWYAFDLIKSLPLLTVLHTLSPIIGKMPYGITHDKLPKYVVSTYHSMGNGSGVTHTGDALASGQEGIQKL
ncbi:hypothetical protein GGH94_000255 [Coemansia aciculifera]|uniref:Uncharacterized protein n=1 Tax=Coemansia aciculifera TaxID=417176 RepID=A0A9W8INL2_9FUNG|nr:hypothetical protein GGH94_000255 [Coemansia aciculifera]KAJ2877156.1 hypothetical protein GGH93_000185 [Coemansia aciculifera]